jgi:hypothetical protein
MALPPKEQAKASEPWFQPKTPRSNPAMPILITIRAFSPMEAMAKAFLNTAPSVDYKTTFGNNDYVLHYDPASAKTYLVIEDRDYSRSAGGLKNGVSWDISIRGRKIPLTISFDASGKEILDAQAYSPVSYSDNFKTLFPKIKTPETVFGAIHFEEGKIFDYLDQELPLEVEAFSVYYDENSLPHALTVTRAEDINSTGDEENHFITASLLTPINANGFAERSVTSWYRKDGSLYEQNGLLSFYDKKPPQVDVGGGHMGKDFNDHLAYLNAQTNDLTGWKQTVIKDGKLYTTTDANNYTRAYHHADKMTITDSLDAAHDWLFDGAYAANGLFHQANENHYGWLSTADPTSIIDFSPMEFSDLQWNMDSVTSTLSGTNRIEKFASAIGDFGYQLFNLVPAAEKSAFYAQLERLSLSFNDDVAQASWEGSQNILRFGMDDLLARKKKTMITLSPEEIEKALNSGFKDPATIAETDSGAYEVSFPTLVFPNGATVQDFLDSIVVTKKDLTAPDIKLCFDNLKRAAGMSFVDVRASDVLVDQEILVLKIAINKVTLYNHSVTLRVMEGNGYKVSFLTDRFAATKTVKDLLNAVLVEDINTGTVGGRSSKTSTAKPLPRPTRISRFSRW